MGDIKKQLREFIEQFDCDYNLLYGTIEPIERQKNIVDEKVRIYDAPIEEIKQEILKLQEIINMERNEMPERWGNLESITSAMLKLLDNNV